MTLGARGVRTRRRLLRATLDVLADEGLAGYSIDAVATRAGIGRATAYSYFANKDAIIVELADALEVRLLRLIARIGPLGPSDYGVANLRWWIAEFVELYSEYSAMFLLWTELLPGRPEPLAPSSVLVLRFADATVRRSPPTISPTVPGSTDLPALSLAVLSSVERIGEFAATTPTNSETMIDALAAGVQCTLFPETTAAHLQAGLDSTLGL
ncbi:hypothetical protein BA059_20610 [Mycolicibacterium sp. (ex Dasyatis americana)]|nr:hypothetical protein BA059_20610 [Mycolicibacterium sp. (ex Dasyatis americana)]